MGKCKIDIYERLEHTYSLKDRQILVAKFFEDSDIKEIFGPGNAVVREPKNLRLVSLDEVVLLETAKFCPVDDAGFPKMPFSVGNPYGTMGAGWLDDNYIYNDYLIAFYREKDKPETYFMMVNKRNEIFCCSEKMIVWRPTPTPERPEYYPGPV